MRSLIFFPRLRINVVKTIIGIPLAFIIWLLIYCVAHIALYLLDLSRGLEDDWLQIIFRELVTPGIGGYTAIVFVDRHLSGANLKWVAIGFCSPLVFFYICVSLYIIIFLRNEYDFFWRDQILYWGITIATCIGANVAYRKFHS